MKSFTHTVRKHQPSAKIVIGNSVAGSIPEIFLKHSDADIAVIGEGEYTTVAVLDAIRDGQTDWHDIEGIAFLDKDGNCIRTPKRKACKIDELPTVDWEFFDTKRYLEMSHAMAHGLVVGDNAQPVCMPVTSARGCAFKCTFCHYVFWDDPYRHRSPENIISEVKRNIEQYGANYINFWDDLSFASIKQAEALADAILESGLKFTWNAAVRVDLFGHPRHSYEKRLSVARKFKESGCVNVGFSLESGNQEILDMMNKRIKVEYFLDQVKVLDEAGVTSNTSVVFGYPIETKETIRETFDMCLRAHVYPSIGFLLPLPYTGMYEYAKEHGYITDEDAYLTAITERQGICLNMTQMSDDEIMDQIKEGGIRLNEQLELGLTEDSLIRTGGYRKHSPKTAHEENPPLDPENIERNVNDFTFNYSKTLFELDTGIENQKEDSTIERR